MGCFSTCFRKSRRRRSRRPAKTSPCFHQILQGDECVEAVPIHLTEQESTKLVINPIPDSIDGEKLNISGRKKVTFDLNVQVYEELPVEDENNGNEVEEVEGEKEENKATKVKEESHCHSDSSSTSSLISVPPKSYRYQDCRDSEDEFDEVVSDDESDNDYLGDDEDDESENEVNNDMVVVRDDQSRFMDSWNKLATIDLDKEFNEDESDESKSFDSVLNPVENLTQWKAVKAWSKVEPQNKAKENMISGQECDFPFVEEPILKPTKAKKPRQEIAVDTSLSTWLAGPEEATPTKSKTSSVSVGNSTCSERTVSPKDFEDRPILGALTVEEIRQFSAASTPRRSPSRSPDDMPIIGSVGSYWNHSGQGSKPGSNSSTRSKYMEGRKNYSNSSRIPFEKRLEKAALQKGTVRL